MRPEPHLAVRAWLNEQAAETLDRYSVTLAELLYGIAVLAGRQAQEHTNSYPRWLDGAVRGSRVAVRHRRSAPLCRTGRDGQKRRAGFPDGSVALTSYPVEWKRRILHSGRTHSA
ncbi:hypothetical protein [Nitrosomonas sp. Nm58]|uniref:hypothetical protein n=1 Tax=Nitrosomonas sp. Nm58 TaxID=200126 RepID=UPI001C431CA5|nr:hypothetical protein [Nitrosomonas sp. Nm58]